jgi:hypothetical protein
LAHTRYLIKPHCKKFGYFLIHFYPGIVLANSIQQNLFDLVDKIKQTILIQTVYESNTKIGKRKNNWDSPVKCSIQTPATKKNSWQMHRSYLSPCDTTKWEQALKAS